MVWPQLRWRHAWFSDESRFPFRRPDGRKKRMYRRCGERYTPCCIYRKSTGSVVVTLWCEHHINQQNEPSVYTGQFNSGKIPKQDHTKAARPTHYTECQRHLLA